VGSQRSDSSLIKDLKTPLIITHKSMPEKPTTRKKPSEPLVIVKTIKNIQKESNQPLTNSLSQFEESELGANFK